MGSDPECICRLDAHCEVHGVSRAAHDRRITQADTIARLEAEIAELRARLASLISQMAEATVSVPWNAGYGPEYVPVAGDPIASVKALIGVFERRQEAENVRLKELLSEAADALELRHAEIDQLRQRAEKAESILRRWYPTLVSINHSHCQDGSKITAAEVWDVLNGQIGGVTPLSRMEQQRDMLRKALELCQHSMYDEMRNRHQAETAYAAAAAALKEMEKK